MDIYFNFFGSIRFVGILKNLVSAQSDKITAIISVTLENIVSVRKYSVITENITKASKYNFCNSNTMDFG